MQTITTLVKANITNPEALLAYAKSQEKAWSTEGEEWTLEKAAEAALVCNAVAPLEIGLEILHKESELEEALPTLDEFLAWGMDMPHNTYLRRPGFGSLYVRKGRILVTRNWGEEPSWCGRVLQIARVIAKPTGQGYFTALVNELVKKDYAVFVENVEDPRFQRHLIKLGFKRVNPNTGIHYLINYEQHLSKTEPY